MCRMEPGGDAIAVVRTGERGVNDGSGAGQLTCQRIFHFEKLLPAVVAPSDAGLVGNLNYRNGPPVGEADDCRSSGNQYHIGRPAKVPGVLHRSEEHTAETKSP